jgi:tRNA pseudouridine55 synthase
MMASAGGSRPEATGDWGQAALTRCPAADGIVLLDKPRGLSSNAALQRVKRALGATKAGHAGTLDPLATGMLPILLGEATKIAGYLLHRDKAYAVTCRLGQSTTTYDAEGEVTRERRVPAIDPDRLHGLLAGFTGLIRQRAPVYSAIKQGGQPLYRRARRGEEVMAPEREVRIDRIEVAAMPHEGQLDLVVECGSGTYIRSLAHDLGEALGCGAHVSALRRLWVSPFRDLPMAGLDEILSGSRPLLPTLAGLAGWPTVQLDPDGWLDVRQGRSIAAAAPGAGPPGPIAAISPGGSLAALLEAGPDGRLRPLRVLAAPA